MIDIPNRLQGVRVALVALDAERDSKNYARWTQDPELMRMFDTSAARPVSVRRSKEFYERFAYKDDAVDWAIKHLETGEVIGLVGFHSIRASHRTGDLHIAIADGGQRGRGLGQEALTLALDYVFLELDWHRVGLNVYAHNDRAVRLYHRMGFRDEGVIRDVLIRDGKWHDMLFMGLLRHEWPPDASVVRRIHHVQICIGAEEVEHARAFYLGGLGLREIDKPQALLSRGGFWAELEGQQIHFGVEQGVDHTLTRAHVAWQVCDLPAWRARLEAAGCLILESIPIPGYDRFETRDPFGNRMEFIQATQ